jgi:penicillin amidase
MVDTDAVETIGVGSVAEIWRDQWGIPHIRAATDHDAFAALGYAHAEDRLWQMDMMRRKAVGRWAEWGGPDGIASDRLARTMGCERAAKRDYHAIGAEARAMLDSYAVGVNGFIVKGSWPLEYELLAATPEAWEPWHSIAVMRQIGFLMGSVWMKMLRAAAVPVVGAESAGKLRFDEGSPERVCMQWDTGTFRAEMSAEVLRGAITDMLCVGAPDLSGGGSNSWAVSGRLTDTGRPILMGDPHRELDVPAMYSQAHIAGATFDAIGLTVPGVPGFPHVCHNAHVAWCVTVAFMDLHDLYTEQFRDHGREVQTPNGWVATRRRIETISVRNGIDVDINIVETGNGPVIAGDLSANRAVALRSAQLDAADLSFDCLQRMMKATDAESLREATRGWGLIDHNIVAADVLGNIAHWVRATVPDRSRTNGWFPVPGWVGEHAWRGMVPFEAMPSSINPASGRIVTANNRVVADQGWPYLSTDCQPPYRAERIAARLDEHERFTIKNMEPIFADVFSIPAALLRERLATLEADGAIGDLRDRLVAWDCQMSANSTAAAEYSRLRLHLTQVVTELSGLAAVSPPYDALLSRQTLVSNIWFVVPGLLRRDDPCLLGGQTWSAAIREALQRTVSENISKAEWAEIHTPQPCHPLSSSYPSAAAQLNPICAPIGGDGDTVMASGCYAGQGLRAAYSSLARYAFDVGEWQNCRWIVYQGASGRHDNPHRSDQNSTWASVEMIPMLFEWGEIVDSCSVLRLAPVPRVVSSMPDA